MIAPMIMSKVKTDGTIHKTYSFIEKINDSWTRLNIRIIAIPDTMMKRDHLLLNTMFCRIDSSGCVALTSCLDFAIIVFMKDRKSTRLNSSHVAISYAVFC